MRSRCWATVSGLIAQILRRWLAGRLLLAFSGGLSERWGPRGRRSSAWSADFGLSAARRRTKVSAGSIAAKELGLSRLVLLVFAGALGVGG